MSRFGNWKNWTLAVAVACGGCSQATNSGPANNPLITANKPKPWSQSVAGATQQVGDALTIKPRIDSPDDPTKLNTSHKPIGSDLYLRSAKLMEAKGDLKMAETQYERAVQQSPRKIEPLIALARFYDRRGKFDRATELYQRAVKLEPQNSAAANDLGLCLSRAGRTNESIAALERAIQLKPRKVLYRNNIATVLISAKRVNEALQHLTAVHTPSVAHYNLGFLLTQQGMNELARTHLQRALDLDASFTAAKLVLGKLPNARGDFRSDSIDVKVLPASTQRNERGSAYRQQERGSAYKQRGGYEQRGAYRSRQNDIQSLPPVK